MKIRELKETGHLEVPVTRTPKQSPGARKKLIKSPQDSLDSQSTADEKSCKEESLIKDEKAERLLVSFTIRRQGFNKCLNVNYVQNLQ